MRHIVGGISAFVLTRKEHPPPHVHFMHAGEGWEIKVHFSYVKDSSPSCKVEYLSKKLPPLSTLNSLIGELIAHRRECRTVWAQCLGDLGLVNKHVFIDKQRTAVLATPKDISAFRVTSATYDSANDLVVFNNGVTGRCP